MQSIEAYTAGHSTLTERIDELADPQSFESAESDGAAARVMALCADFAREFAGLQDFEQLRDIADLLDEITTEFDSVLSRHATAAQGSPQEADFAPLFSRAQSEYKPALRNKLTSARSQGFVAEFLDRFGLTEETIEDRTYGMKMIFDLRQTAALVRKLIFTKPSFNGRDQAFVADYGAGTGITSVSGAINALRNGFSKVQILCVEQSPDIVRLDQMQSVLQSKRGQTEYKVARNDLSQSSTYAPLAMLVRMARKDPYFIISETINCTMPQGPVIASDGSIGWPREMATQLKGMRHTDPFPYVLHNVNQAVPDFVSKVRARSILLFPDVITDDVCLEGNSSRMLAYDGVTKHTKLTEIGQDFSGFEAINSRPRFKAT